MTLRTLLAACVLIAAPALVQAQCMWGEHSTEAAISCADGSTWDPVAMTCVVSASS